MRLPAELRASLGSPVVAVTSAPWGSKNRTSIVDLADGRQLVIQHYRDRQAARVRTDALVSLSTPLRNLGVPVPTVLAADLDGDEPWAALDRMPGELAYIAAEDDLSGPLFPEIAREMGRALAAIRSLPTAGLPVPALWSRPAELARAADGWLAGLRPHLRDEDVGAVRRILETVPELFAGRAPVLAHGDFGPQNVLAVGGEVTAVLDWEDVRLADPLLDVAWWAWLVRAHTPEAFARSWAEFLKSAGVDPQQERFAQRLNALIALRLLDTADVIRRTIPAKHPSWGRRLADALPWQWDAP